MLIHERQDIVTGNDRHGTSVLTQRNREKAVAIPEKRRHGSAGLGWMDALIVATAAQANLPVLTRDLKLVRCLGEESTFDIYRRDSKTAVLPQPPAELRIGER